MRRSMQVIRQVLTHPLFLRATGIVVGGVFVYASLDKIARPDRFADIVHDYQMLPLLFINAFALAMPWTEITTGAALILGVWRRGAGLLAMALTVAFLVAIAQAEIRGLDIECGCFDVSGMSSTEASWDLFLRDIPLLLGAALVWRKG
ncbi:MAG TPA: MauE/DoxX family redox-associated membrane protein [Armatimonadota bacterium]|nr:MauE/DoxX family redox-associated membrane protein [Armatimonadota bacterium]